jgi:DNA polymerase-3 subunit gamma/tau
MPDDAHPSSTTTSSASREYVVVARRYRPKDFDQLVGQEHVGKALASAIASGRVGHAYLFTGARGVGKTSTARILAKSLNCVKGPTATPCHECDPCQRIAAGDDIDVLEIDGASNRGIDEMRDLRQNVNVRPSRSRYKIYIIDEVHMLTREAFNALLKTLEEPPGHVKFIFCTTEAEKIPVTILSRCQRFDFASIRTSAITERLAAIVKSEGIEAEPAALALIARRAAGSMRDSQSLLEQLLALGKQSIAAADVHRLLGTAGEERVARVVACLVDRQPAQALAELDETIAQGVDIGSFLEQLVGHFRDVLVMAAGASADLCLHALPDQIEDVRRLAGRLGMETLLAILQILDHTLMRLKYSVHTRVLAEMALVRIAQLENLDHLGQWLAEARKAGSAAGGPVPLPALPPTVSPVRPLLNSPVAKHAETLPAPAPEFGNQTARATLETTQALSAEQPQADLEVPDFTLDQLRQIWAQVLSRPGDMLIGQAQKGTPIAICAPNRLVVEFAKTYTVFKTACERPENLKRLCDMVSAAAGRPVVIEFVVSETEPGDAPRPARQAAGPTSRERLMEVSKHPMIRRAIELFDAHAVRVDEAEPTD